MWDLVTEYATAKLESPFVAWSLVGIYCIVCWSVIRWGVLKWRVPQNAAREEARSHYVDPAYPRVATRSDATLRPLVEATGPARGPYRVSRRAMELGVSPSGLDEDSCFQTTGLTRSPQDAA